MPSLYSDTKNWTKYFCSIGLLNLQFPGKNTGFGINANVIIPFEVNKGVIAKPYAGLGVGYNQAAGDSTFAPNLVLGTSFSLLGGKLFADYTAHNFFDIHQISVGYKLNF